MNAVADQFAATLATAGVKRIYGIVGDTLNGLTDAIRTRMPARHGWISKSSWITGSPSRAVNPSDIPAFNREMLEQFGKAGDGRPLSPRAT